MMRPLPVLAWLCLLVPGSLQAQRPAGRVQANDNRRPAGRLEEGTLALRLVARTASWHPYGPRADGAPMQAFAEEGGPARIPGPLVRVPAGTTVAVVVRNALTDTLRVRGLHPRGGATAPDTTPLVIPPGGSASTRFRLDAPGTWYYWGTTTDRGISWRTGLDSQLGGAIVVDPAGTNPSQPGDRIFVVGMWSDTVHRAGTHRQRVLGVINGRAWPEGERLDATVGDTVRWRLVNLSADLHPMHLHGFYFRVTSRGTIARDVPVAERDQQPVVTENLAPGSSLGVTWVPERAGNWLFHCHVPEHFAPRGPLGLLPVATSHASTHDHAMGGMGGMVMGITVKPRPGARTREAAPAPVTARRALRLLVRPTVGSNAAVPLYAYAVHERGAGEPPLDTGLVASPPIDLVRGEPVAITVVNRLPEPTAVHWHGIELESYYDGVPGVSGQGRQVTPLIAPGDSFTVHFTPPRAGTFIYHTHAEEVRQQAAGLAGPLIVREPGTTRDPATDIPVVLTSPTDFSLNMKEALFNGRLSPPPLTMEVGRTYRLRLIGMSAARVAMTLERRRADSLLTWRLVAKDGANRSPAASAEVPARLFVAVGETYDVEVTPSAEGDEELRMLFGLNPEGVRIGPVVQLASWRVRVTAPGRSQP